MTRRWTAYVAALSIALAMAGVPGRAQSVISLPRSVPSFNQAYSSGPGAWGNETLGTDGCPDLLRATGCLVAAFAAVLAYYDVALDIPATLSSTGERRVGMDPGILNDWLRARSGYGTCSGDPLGSCCLEWERLPRGVDLSFHVNRSDVGLDPIATVIIDHALRLGRPIVAGVHWSAYCRTGSSQTEDCHWIVVTGKMGSTYTIVDPYNSDTSSPYGVHTTLSLGSRGRYVIDRFVVIEKGLDDASASNSLAVVVPDVPPVTPAADTETGAGATLIALVFALALVAAAVLLAGKPLP